MSVVLPFFSTPLLFIFHCRWCWLSFPGVSAVSATLGFPGVSLCAGRAVDCDWDRTRQQGREGGRERKAARKREGRDPECVVNGRFERPLGEKRALLKAFFFLP